MIKIRFEWGNEEKTKIGAFNVNGVSETECLMVGRGVIQRAGYILLDFYTVKN